MNIRALFFALIVLCLCRSVFAQPLSDTEQAEMQELLDSAEYYKLTNGRRAFEFASVILNQVPAEGNEKLRIRALAIAANSQKVIGTKESALALISEGIRLSEKVNDVFQLVRAYYMKATIFDQNDEMDSSLVYYQLAISRHEPGMQAFYLSTANTNIGKIYQTIGNYQKAEEYILKGYHQSRQASEYDKLFALSAVISFYSRQDDPRYLPYLDTLAMSDFFQKASPASRLAHFDSFLQLEKATDEEREKRLREVYAYSLSNGSLVNQVGFGMRLYEHLDKMHRYQEAHALLLELYEKAVRSQNGFELAGVIRALYNNARSRGDLQQALIYLERHGVMRDSLLSVENANALTEMNIRFETAQKDHEIGQQKTRIEQAQRDRRFLIALTGLLAALALMVYFFFRNKARTTRRLAEQEKVIHAQEKERMLREKEVAELTASLQTQERERNRIARDLHDGLGSLMSGISAQIETLRVQPSVEAAGSPYLGQLRDMVKEATAELRRTSYELMPASLLRQGLEPALRDLCMNLLVKNGIEPSLEINADLTTLNHEQQLTIYRIIQELLNNVVKHAGAKNVLMQFNHYDNEFSVVVEDDGKGFNVEEKKQTGGLGLGSLQSRVNLLKGLLDIASVPGEGTTVTVNFALAEEKKVNQLKAT